MEALIVMGCLIAAVALVKILQGLAAGEEKKMARRRAEVNLEAELEEATTRKEASKARVKFSENSS